MNWKAELYDIIWKRVFKLTKFFLVTAKETAFLGESLLMLAIDKSHRLKKGSCTTQASFRSPYIVTISTTWSLWIERTFFSVLYEEAAWLSGQRVGFAIQRFRVWVPLFPLPWFVSRQQWVENISNTLHCVAALSFSFLWRKDPTSERRITSGWAKKWGEVRRASEKGEGVGSFLPFACFFGNACHACK